jgi:hypothetical protein
MQRFRDFERLATRSAEGQAAVAATPINEWPDMTARGTRGLGIGFGGIRRDSLGFWFASHHGSLKKRDRLLVGLPLCTQHVEPRIPQQLSKSGQIVGTGEQQDLGTAAFRAMIVATERNRKSGGKTAITQLLRVGHCKLHARDNVRIGKQTIGFCG